MSRRRDIVWIWVVTTFCGVAMAGEPADNVRTLSEADVIRTALANNPTLAAAMADLRRAEALVAGEEARYGFVLRADAGYTHGQTPILGASGVNVPQADNLVLGGELRRHLVLGTDLALRVEGSFQATQSELATQPGSLVGLGPAYGALVRLRVTQPLLRGAGADVGEAGLASARVAAQKARATRDRNASELLRDVLAAYWDLYYASETLTIQRQAQALAQGQRDEAAARVETGGLAPVEVYAFETQVASLAEEVANAEAEVQRRSIELARVLGATTDGQDLRAQTDVTPPEPPLPTGDLREWAVAAFPQIAELRQAVELAVVQERTATEPYRHRLDLDGWVQLQGLGDREVGPAFTQLGEAKGFGAYVGLVYEAPLDSTQREAEAARARLAVTSARAQLDAAIDRVVADLNVALSRDVAARLRLELARATRTIAARQLAAEEARFATGGTTSLQVSQAQEQLRQASLRLLRAQIDIIQNVVGVSHLTGGLLVEHAADLETSR